MVVELHPRMKLLFAIDNSHSHHKLAEDALRVSVHVPLKDGEKVLH